MTDYRTSEQRARDLKREREEQRQRDADLQKARRTEIDRMLEIREVFPEFASRDLSTTGVVGWAYHLKDLDHMEATWARIWHRSHDVYLAATEAGDTALANVVREELDHLSYVCTAVSDTRKIRDDLREANAAAKAS